MSLFCFCAGILSLAYYVLIVVYAGITADFAWFWVLLTAVLEGGAVLIRYVVLGAHVKGDVPSKALELRLKAALKYARENEDTTLILSGGQGFGEDITEAKCMENYLTAHGISQELLVLEEKSTSTKENLKFSDELTGCSKKNCGGIRSYYAGALCGAGSSSTCKRKTSGKYLIFYHLYFADY